MVQSPVFHGSGPRSRPRNIENQAARQRLVVMVPAVTMAGNDGNYPLSRKSIFTSNWSTMSIYIYMYVYMHRYINIGSSSYLQLYTVVMYIYIYCVYIYIYTYECNYLYIYINIHIYIYICIYIYKYIFRRHHCQNHEAYRLKHV